MGFDSTFDRRSGVGASESYAAVNNCIELWMEKRGLNEPFTGNEATRLGNATEAINIEMGAAKAGVEILGINEMTHRHPKHPGIFATADAFGHAEINGRREKVIIEAKMVGVRRAAHWGDPRDGWDAIPDYVRTQVVQQMAVYDVWYAYVSCLMGTEIRVYGPLIRDLDKERDQIKATLEFLQRVKDGDEPPVDSKPAWRKYLAEKYRKARVGTKKGGAETARRISRRLELNELIGDLSNERDAIDNKLRAEIGNGKMDTIETDSGVATWKANRRGNRVLKIKGGKK